MKKKITILAVFILLILVGAALGRNFIIRKVLEVKLTEVNNGKVDIKSVDFSPFKKKIIITGIDVTSKKDSLKNFVSIGKLEADYDLYIPEKKVLISNADFTDVEFMTNRIKDGSMSHIVRDEDSKVVEVENLEEEKNNAVKGLEKFIEDRTNVTQEVVKNTVENNYKILEKQLLDKKNNWKNKIKKLENTKDYKIVKDVYTQVSKEKNPIKLIRMEKSIKRAGHSFKNLSKEILKDRKEILNDFRTIDTNELNNSLKNNINQIVGKGELVAVDLDSLVNFYLNEICKESVEEFVERYRSVMKEVEIRRDEDMKATDQWEVFVERVGLESRIYGINLKGELNSISSRLSKNLEDTEFSLKADSTNTLGEVKGVLNIQKLRGDIKVDISNVDFKDIKNLEILDRYVESGQAKLVKDIVLTRDNIYLNGDVVIKKMKLNPEQISGQLKISNPFLKDMILPLLSRVNIGEVKYIYNSEKGKLKVESNLSKEITKLLNSDKGEIRKKIAADMLKQGEESVAKYREQLEKENQKTLKELENTLNLQTEYLNKIEDVLDKFNIKVNSKEADKLLKKIFK